MQESTTDKATHSVPLAEQMMDALVSDNRFLYYKDLDYRINKDECKSISQFAFYDLANQIDDPNLAIRLSFVIQTVHSLGNATRNMILSYLKWLKRMYPDKLIPATGEDEQKNQNDLRKLLKRLLDKGLLAAYDYVTEVDRKRVVVYACTQYGWIFYRNKLQVQTNYDTNAVFRTDVDVLKRLAVASVASALCTDERCIGLHMNDRYGSTKYRDIEAYTFGIVEYTDGLILLEPVFYRYDPKIHTGEEINEKNMKRMEQLQKALNQFSQKDGEKPIKVCFIIEDRVGLTKLFNIASASQTEPMFANAIYTSDSIISMNQLNELDRDFMRIVQSKKKEGYSIVPANQVWSEF